MPACSSPYIETWESSVDAPDRRGAGVRGASKHTSRTPTAEASAWLSESISGTALNHQSIPPPEKQYQLSSTVGDMQREKKFKINKTVCGSEKGLLQKRSDTARKTTQSSLKSGHPLWIDSMQFEPHQQMNPRSLNVCGGTV